MKSPMFNPFMLWADLAMKSAEMLVSSGQVINHRVNRMANAGANPSPRDVKEFTLMGSEKVKAATQSGLAVASQMQSANWQLMARGWQQWFSAMNAMASLGNSKTFGQALSRQHTAWNALVRSGKTNSKLSASAAKLGHAALKPVHAAATANAKRLSRVKTQRPAR